MASDYYLLFKTAQAEFRAWNHAPTDIKDAILPIIELTRGRKNAKVGKEASDEQLRTLAGAYDFNKVVSSVVEAFSDCETAILDLTREDSLTSFEIESLAISDNGYAAWRAFTTGISTKFRALVPTLLINPSDEETPEQYKSNISGQLDWIMSDFSGAAYRVSVLLDTDFLFDLNWLSADVNRHIEQGKRFIVELDHEFIRPRTGILHAVRTSSLVDKILALIPKAEVVVLSTSFPKSIEELGDADHDTFPREEIFLYDQVRTTVAAPDSVYYGDYGSINPIRNDIIASGGWRPRIDFPTASSSTFYYREKRDVLGRTPEGKAIYSDYGKHYARVAKKVRTDPMFELISGSWGVEQIVAAAEVAVPSKSPSFWISVRMEIHLRQTVRWKRSA